MTLQVVVGEEERNTEELHVRFKDRNGEDYYLHIHKRHSDIALGNHIDIDLTYPNGHTMGLESIWFDGKESEDE